MHVEQVPARKHSPKISAALQHFDLAGFQQEGCNIGIFVAYGVRRGGENNGIAIG
jgi:hypothetical protein